MGGKKNRVFVTGYVLQNRVVLVGSCFTKFTDRLSYRAEAIQQVKTASSDHSITPSLSKRILESNLPSLYVGSFTSSRAVLRRQSAR